MGTKNLRRIEELMLVAEAKRGERGAFVELVHRHDRDVLRLALHVTGSEDQATGIYLQTFLKASHTISSFEFDRSFQVWILRITAQLCAAFLDRKQAREHEASLPSHPGGDEFDLVEHAEQAWAGMSVEGAAADRKSKRRMKVELCSLGSRERLVFELKHSQGLRLDTIAEILNIPAESAKAALIGATRELLAVIAGKDSVPREKRDNFLDAVT